MTIAPHSQSPNEQTEAFLPSWQRRTDAESVKAHDRFAAHIRAALTASAFGRKRLPLRRNASQCRVQNRLIHADTQRIQTHSCESNQAKIFGAAALETHSFGLQSSRLFMGGLDTRATDSSPEKLLT